MASHTPDFGFNYFGPGVVGSITDEGSKFTLGDRLMLSRVLASLATHDHTGGVRVGDPSTTPALALDTGAGQLPGGLNVYYRVSYLDQYNLETAASAEAIISTPALLVAPSFPILTAEAMPGGDVNPGLGAGLYLYALTAVAGPQQTPLGLAAQLTLDGTLPTIVVTFPDAGQDAQDQWNVWRKGPSEDYFSLIASVDITDTEYVDDGAVLADPDAGDPGHQPPSTNVTNSTNQITVVVPDPSEVGADPSVVKKWRLYRSFTSGVYAASSLVVEMATTVNEDGTGGLLTEYVDDGTTPLLQGQPLDVSQVLTPTPRVQGGVRTGRFLPIDETTMAQTVEFNPDTLAEPSGFDADIAPSGSPFVEGFVLRLLATSPASGLYFNVADSPAFAGLGTGVRAAPAVANTISLGMSDQPQEELRSLAVVLFPDETQLVAAGLRVGQAFRVDFFYRMANPNSMVTAVIGSYDGTDGRSVTGQFSDADPLDGEFGDDPNDDRVIWGDGLGVPSSLWIPASFTVPGACQTLTFKESLLPGWKPTGTDADLSMEIAYLRITPVLDGLGEGDTFIELATEAEFVWDTSVSAFIDPGAGADDAHHLGQGWFNTRAGKALGFNEWDLDTATDGERMILGSPRLSDPRDLAGQRFGTAANDRSPVVLTATLPITASSGTTNLAMAGVGADTTVLPWKVPPGFDWTKARVAAVSFVADQAIAADVTLTVARIKKSDGSTVTPWPGWNDTVDVRPDSFDSRASGSVTNLVVVTTGELLEGDLLEFSLSYGAISVATNVVVTVYFGGLYE